MTDQPSNSSAALLALLEVRHAVDGAELCEKDKLRILNAIQTLYVEINEEGLSTPRVSGLWSELKEYRKRVPALLVVEAYLPRTFCST